VSDRLDLAALLANPVRATEVPAGRRQAVLDALAIQEGRCRLVRDLLTAGLVVKEEHTLPPVNGVAQAEWLRAHEVAQRLGCSGRSAE
jgi:hypothetical protein